MNAYPTDLKLLDAEQLQITWNDGVQQVLTVQQLRAGCPCATCRTRQSGPAAEPELRPVLSPEETQPLRFVSLRPVGNYAYAIAFSDGHDTGIFPIELLRRLGEAAR